MQHETKAPPDVPPPVFMMGQDQTGHWVVRERGGACGGVFVDRVQAMKYVRFEAGSRPHGLVLVNGLLELDVTPGGGSQSRAANNAAYARRAA